MFLKDQEKKTYADAKPTLLLRYIQEKGMFLNSKLSHPR